MRDHYDFSNSKPNPYAAQLNQKVTLNVAPEAVAYFEKIAAEKGVSCQYLMSLYLRDCANKHTPLNMN